MKAKELYEELYEALRRYQISSNYGDLVAAVNRITGEIKDGAHGLAPDCTVFLQRWASFPIPDSARGKYEEARQFYELTCFWAGVGCWNLE